MRVPRSHTYPTPPTCLIINSLLQDLLATSRTFAFIPTLEGRCQIQESTTLAVP